MSDEIRPASDEEIARWHEVAADVRNRHASEIPNRFISMDIRLTGLLELLARIEQDRATIAAKDAEIERLRKVRTGSAIERLRNLCDGFEEMDKEQEAELATARAQIAALRAILSDAVELGWDRSSAIRRMTAALAASATRADAAREAGKS